jgi:hypothetical protein
MALENSKAPQAQKDSLRRQVKSTLATVKAERVVPVISKPVTEGAVRDEASIAILKNLRDKLLSKNISIARVAASNLAWKQEDGLTILTEALFGDYPRNTKKAAAYGLRRMNGRMQKMAIEVLNKGLKHNDRTTKAACIKSLSLMEEQSGKKLIS